MVMVKGMEDSTNCPGEEALRLVLLGNASLSTTEKILSHIELCPLCPDRLDQIARRENATKQEAPLLVQASEVPFHSGFSGGLAGHDSVALLASLLARTDAAQFDLGFLPCSPNPNMLGRLGRYDLVRVIGSGGMGIVFQAVADSGETVALKTLKPGQTSNKTVLSRFLRETRAAQNIRHPGVVPVIDSGTEGRLPFFVMPLLKGMNFEKLIRLHAPMDFHDAISLTRQAADILRASHERGILHRDIKPSNLWVQSWKDSGSSVHLLDFGLALFDLTETPLTSTGAILGTPAYFSPEQADGGGDNLVPSSDLFSLGCVFYEMLTGEKVFPGKNALETLRCMLRHKIVPPKTLRPSIPWPLNDLVMRLLARDPKARPATAAELIVLLDEPGLLRNPLINRRRILATGLLAAGATLGYSAWRMTRPKPVTILRPTSSLALPDAVQFDLAKSWDKNYQGKGLVWVDNQGKVWRMKATGGEREQIGPFEFRPVMIRHGLQNMALVSDQGEIRFVHFEDKLIQLLDRKYIITHAPNPSDPPKKQKPEILWDGVDNRFLVASGQEVKIFDGTSGDQVDTVTPNMGSSVTSLVARPPSITGGRGFVATQANGAIGLLNETNLLIYQSPLLDPPQDFRIDIRHDSVEAAALDSSGDVSLWQASNFTFRLKKNKIDWGDFQSSDGRESSEVRAFKPCSIHYGLSGTVLLAHGMVERVSRALLYSTLRDCVVARLGVEDPVQVIVDIPDAWVLDRQGILHHFAKFESQANRL